MIVPPTLCIACRGDWIDPAKNTMPDRFPGLLATGLDLRLCLTHESLAKPRYMAVDCIYGEHISAPTHIGGHDEGYGEIRHYRLDRITSILCRKGLVISRRIPWLFGALLSSIAEIDIPMPPFRVDDIAYPVRLVISGDEKTEVAIGKILSATLSHRGADVHLDAYFEGTRTDTCRAIKRRLTLLPEREWEKVCLFNPVTGEPIDFIASELAQAGGLDLNGVESDYDIEAEIHALCSGWGCA